MYTTNTMMFELAKTKQRDLLVEAEKLHRAQKVRKAAAAAAASEQTPSRSRRRAWQIVLRPQSQS